MKNRPRWSATATMVGGGAYGWHAGTTMRRKGEEAGAHSAGRGRGRRPESVRRRTNGLGDERVAGAGVVLPRSDGDDGRGRRRLLARATMTASAGAAGGVGAAWRRRGRGDDGGARTASGQRTASIWAAWRRRCRRRRRGGNCEMRSEIFTSPGYIARALAPVRGTNRD